MSSLEFSEWIAYYNLEPFGLERFDLHAGIVASTIANVNRERNREPYSPLDFMPFQPRPQQSWQDQLALVEQLNILFGGSDTRTSPE
ncbi:MAG: DUF4035 domain-containing protein [Caldilineales bacterium]|nr:DUF4035 domain-containing protein [Caldilineales bacterium]